MRKTLKLIFLSFVVAGFTSCETSKTNEKEIITPPKYAIIIHGGAGYRQPGDSLGDAQYIDRLNNVLLEGERRIAQGVDAIDVVQFCISLMEDDSLFNAGRGAVFAADGTNKMDASIMDGKSMNGGAVAGVSTIKNPIFAARMVMDSSSHVLLTGADADLFARLKGLDIVDPAYFYTDKNMRRLLEVQEKTSAKKDKHGTVGCVVVDLKGNIAAGTSTGGMTNKKWGRIGDSPILGAGTYAENNVCGVSATGHGEYFIRYAVAHDIAARMKYSGVSLQAACDSVVQSVLKNAGGAGGVIALDAKGNVAASFNTTAMFRGHIREGESAVVEIY